MKKTSKKILGIVGLTLVAAMTVFAILLPETGASALETNPVTDEVQVRVVGSVPKITLTYPENDAIFLDPEQYFAFDFENIDTTTTEVRYTDSEGELHIYTIDTEDPDYATGSSEHYALDLAGEQYGYGDYEIVAKGVGFDGVTAEDTIRFSYYPVYGTIEGTSKRGSYKLNLHYYANTENLDAIIINVYDSEGNLVTAISPITVENPTTEVELPFEENGLKSGEYTITIVGVDADGNELSAPYVLTLDYTAPEEEEEEEENEAVPVPDTGVFFGTINMSSSDIIMTGMIVFIALATVAIAVIIRSKKDKKVETLNKE